MAKIKDTRHISKAKAAEIAQRRAEMQTEIRRLAAIANKRLRALEAHNLTESSNAYRYIEKRHFDKDSAIAETRSGKIKFDESLSKKTAQQLQHELVELKRFLYEAKTSTVAGTKDRYTRAYNTYIANHPNTKISREDFDAILSAEGFRSYARRFGSSAVEDLLEMRNDRIPLNDIERALGELGEDQTLSEFMANAQPPSEWQQNEAGNQTPITDLDLLAKFQEEGFQFYDERPDDK